MTLGIKHRLASGDNPNQHVVKDWLARAMARGGDALKRQALEDPDLEPLYKDIGSL